MTREEETVALFQTLLSCTLSKKKQKNIANSKIKKMPNFDQYLTSHQRINKEGRYCKFENCNSKHK